MATAGEPEKRALSPMDQEYLLHDFIEEVHLDTLLPVVGVLSEHLKKEERNLENSLIGHSTDQVLLKRVGCPERLRKSLKSVGQTLQDLERPRMAALAVRTRLAMASRLIFRETQLSIYLRQRLKAPQ